jgi:hypothetical protein
VAGVRDAGVALKKLPGPRKKDAAIVPCRNGSKRVCRGTARASGVAHRLLLAKCGTDRRDRVASRQQKEVRMTKWKQLSSLAAAMLLSGGFVGSAIAQYGTTPASPPKQGATEQPGKAMAPAEGMKIAAPSKAETADAAFKKLDASGKGYVTMDDTKSLSGFDKAFQSADMNHDGKLTADEFKKAWQDYTGNKS